MALRESGVSDLRFNERVTLPATDIELVCNRLAAAALMPKETILAVLPTGGVGVDSLPDEDIAMFARRFGVSKLALLLRLVTLERASWRFYFEKQSQYVDEYRTQRVAQPVARERKRNVPQESLSDLGRPLVALLLDSYHQRNITLSDVAGYLGVRVKHVQTLERRLAA